MLIPDDMIEVCGKIFGGEYNVDYNNPKPTILDIGANVGAFTRWAKYKWPNSTIHAYEPLPECVEYLVKNTNDLKGVFIHQCAVDAAPGVRKLYYGTDSRGMSSFEKSEYTRDHGVEVSVVAASTLPRADIVKCDTEGSELGILMSLGFEPDVVLVEYHSLDDKKRIEKMYSDKYILFEFDLMSLRCGTMKFIKESTVREL